MSLFTVILEYIVLFCIPGKNHERPGIIVKVEHAGYDIACSGDSGVNSLHLSAGVFQDNQLHAFSTGNGGVGKIELYPQQFTCFGVLRLYFQVLPRRKQGQKQEQDDRFFHEI
jgi:hypothetical protein